MRYAFTDESISLINRVYNAVTSFVSTMYQTPTTPTVLLGTMWMESDRMADWQGEGDVLSDNTVLVEAQNYTAKYVQKNRDAINSNEGYEYNEYVAMSDILTDAEGVVIEFENKLWLACNVVNAVCGIESNAINLWTSEEALGKVNDEFAKDRDNINAKANEILRKNHHFVALMKSLIAKAR